MKKFKDCIAYDAETEITRQELGTAGGKVLYKETEITLSERCSARNLLDDFDCSQCEIYQKLNLKKK